MDTISIISPASPSRALRLLLDQVLAGGDAVLIVEDDEGRALLDQAASGLAGQRHRVLRAAAAGPGGLGLSGLMAQVAGQPGLALQDDAVLERGFRMLTAPDETCAHIVLLVSGAQGLHRSTLRYVQFACHAGASLRLVLAGEPGLMEVLGWDEAEFLHPRLASRPVIVVEAPDPVRAPDSVRAPDPVKTPDPVKASGPGTAAPVPDRAARGALSGAQSPGAAITGLAAPATARTRRWAGEAALGLAISLGMVASLALGVGVSRHGWPVLHPAPMKADDAGAGRLPRPVAQAAPPAVLAAPPASEAPPAAGRTIAGDSPAVPSFPASNGAAGPSAGAAPPLANAADAPGRTARDAPVAPQPATQDAPAQPSPREAGTAAPHRMIPAPSAASPAGAADGFPGAGPAVQQPAAQGMAAAPVPPAPAAAAIPDQSAPPAHAAAAPLDEAGTAPSALPRPRRRTAARQADAPAKEAQQDAEPQQGSSRRDKAAPPRSTARPVSLHTRPEDRGDLPIPPLERRPRPAAPRAGPPEPETGSRSYIGTYGTDANGLRTFHPGQ